MEVPVRRKYETDEVYFLFETGCAPFLPKFVLESGNVVRRLLFSMEDALVLPRIYGFFAAFVGTFVTHGCSPLFFFHCGRVTEPPLRINISGESVPGG